MKWVGRSIVYNGMLTGKCGGSHGDGKSPFCSHFSKDWLGQRSSVDAKSGGGAILMMSRIFWWSQRASLGIFDYLWEKKIVSIRWENPDRILSGSLKLVSPVRIRWTSCAFGVGHTILRKYSTQQYVTLKVMARKRIKLYVNVMSCFRWR